MYFIIVPVLLGCCYDVVKVLLGYCWGIVGMLVGCCLGVVGGDVFGILFPKIPSCH